MQSKIFDHISFYAFFLTTILLPIFFLPFSKIPLETSKSLVVVLGLTVSVTAWAIARFFDGRMNLPRSSVLLAGLGIVFSFLISALASPVKAWSFWGIMFDVGSFWFIFASFMLMFSASVIVSDKKRARIMLLGVMSSFSVVLIFQFFHLFFTAQTAFGVLNSKVDTLLGSWNVLGILAGLLVLVSLFSIEFLSSSKRSKLFTGVFLCLAYVFVLLINYSFVLWLISIFTLIIFVSKFLHYTRNKALGLEKTTFPILPLSVLIFSILFLMSGAPIRGFLPQKLGVSDNVEIRAPLSATISIGKETLKHRPVFGAGPNRFGDMWSLYKPAEVNQGSLWDISFDFGWGLLPTFIITTGILGFLFWFLFLILLVFMGARVIFSAIQDKSNYESALFFLASIYLFIASCFHPFGATLFFLAFILAGAFIGVVSSVSVNGVIKFSFLDDPRKSFFTIIFLIVLIIVSVLASIKFAQRFSSVKYFKQALALEDPLTAESAINQALALNKNDLYFRTATQIGVAKLRAQIGQNPKPSEEEAVVLKSILDQAINSAVMSTEYNHTNYLNFLTLGIVYEFAGSLGAPGYYEKALASYRSASVLNPLNPGIKLAMARASLATKNKAEAKGYAEESFALKNDYVDVLIFLSQLAKGDGDVAKARTYAEAALYLLPGNEQIIKYLDSLKTPPPAPVEDKKTKKGSSN